MSYSLETIAERTRDLMREHGREHLGSSLQDLGWAFRFDRARRRLGVCRFSHGPRRVRVISLSGPISTRHGWALMEDVARHEIAHALDFETRGRSGHDAVWREWARRCGADPSCLYEGELYDDPASRFKGRCPVDGCDYVRPFYRAVTAAYFCPRCDVDGVRRYLHIEERATGGVLRAGGVAPGSAPAISAKFVGHCPACGASRPFGRRPTRRYACTSCCRTHAGGRFDERFEMVLLRLR